jgi:hypothetical protein
MKAAEATKRSGLKPQRQPKLGHVRATVDRIIRARTWLSCRFRCQPVRTPDPLEDCEDDRPRRAADAARPRRRSDRIVRLFCCICSRQLLALNVASNPSCRGSAYWGQSGQRCGGAVMRAFNPNRSFVVGGISCRGGRQPQKRFSHGGNALWCHRHADMADTGHRRDLQIGPHRL